MPRKRHPESPEARRTQIAVGGSVLILAVAIVLYGAPRFLDALDSVNMRQTTGALLKNEQIPPEQFQDALRYVQGLSIAQEAPPQRAAAGYVLLRAALAEREKDPAAFRRYLEQAEAALSSALRQRPADSYSWARLALVRLELRRPLGDVLMAWRLSVQTAPFEPQLLVWRLGIGLGLYSQMETADRETVWQQTLGAWDASQWRTARLLALYERPDLLRPQLQERPEKERAKFEEGYNWFLQEKQQNPQTKL